MLQSLPVVSAEPVAWMRNPEAETHYKPFMSEIHRSSWIEELPNGSVERLYSIPLYTSPQALTTITADDVTDEMWKAYYKTIPETTIEKSDFAAAVNAYLAINHRSEAR